MAASLTRSCAASWGRDSDQTFVGPAPSNVFERHAQASHPSSISPCGNAGAFFCQKRDTDSSRGVRSCRNRTPRQGCKSRRVVLSVPDVRRSQSDHLTCHFSRPMSVKLARSAGLLSVATMACRVLGVAREMVLAAFFGASGGVEMDAFNVAFRVPNLVRDLFAEGAMTAAFVPTFTHTLTTRGPEAAWRLGNLVINALFLVTGALVLLGMLFAGPITHAIAPGFTDIPGKLELTTQLTRIMLPFLTTVAAAVAMMGMLNSLRRFFIPALAPAMFNVATIVCAFALVPAMPHVGQPAIVAIAIGT